MTWLGSLEQIIILRRIRVVVASKKSRHWYWTRRFSASKACPSTEILQNDEYNTKILRVASKLDLHYLSRFGRKMVRAAKRCYRLQVQTQISKLSEFKTFWDNDCLDADLIEYHAVWLRRISVRFGKHIIVDMKASQKALGQKVHNPFPTPTFGVASVPQTCLACSIGLSSGAVADYEPEQQQV